MDGAEYDHFNHKMDELREALYRQEATLAKMEREIRVIGIVLAITGVVVLFFKT